MTFFVVWHLVILNLVRVLDMCLNSLQEHCSYNPHLTSTAWIHWTYSASSSEKGYLLIQYLKYIPHISYNSNYLLWLFKFFILIFSNYEFLYFWLILSTQSDFNNPILDLTFILFFNLCKIVTTNLLNSVYIWS